MDRGDAAVHARDDLLGDGDRINVVHVQAITEPGHAGSDLVELDALLASVYARISPWGSL